MDEKSEAESNVRFVEQFFELWINPEIERRHKEGRLPEDFVLFAAQVIMNFDSPTEVRLNKEVKAVVRGESSRPTTKGEMVSIDDMLEDIKTIELTQHDPNAGHLTMLLHRGQWFIAFDFRYNAKLVLEHLKTAQQYLDSAAASITRGHLRVFVDNLFSAVELTAKGALLMHNKTVFSSHKHGVIHSRFNQWGRLGNIDSRYTRLLNRLSSLRPGLRYVQKDVTLTTEEAESMLEIAKDMIADLGKRVPARGGS